MWIKEKSSERERDFKQGYTHPDAVIEGYIYSVINI
jgi:hypothetical protein